MKVWPQLWRLSTKATGFHSIIATWPRGYNAQAIFMVPCAKLIHAQPVLCAQAATCPHTIVVNATASYLPSAKSGHLVLSRAVLASLCSGTRVKNSSCTPQVMAEPQQT